MSRARLQFLALFISLFVLLPLLGSSPSVAQEAATPVASPMSGAPAPGWTNWKGDAGRTGVADAGPTGEPVELWRVQASGSCNPSPAVVAGVVYASCDDGILYALDAATGAERWRFTGTTLSDVTVTGGLAYVNDDDVLRALNAATGEERWEAAVPGGTSAVVDDALLVIGTGDGDLLGLDPTTGAERWRFQLSTTGAAHNPALADGIAYAGSEDSGFFAVDAVTGTLLWRGDTGDDVTATAVVADGVAYVGGTPDSAEGHLYAFDATTGALRWKLDQPLFSPTVRDGIGYAGSGTGVVVSFDTATGTARWQTQLGGIVRNVVIAGDVLYTLSDGNNAVYALDAATGDQLWTFPVDGGIESGIAVSEGGLYLGTTFGGIYAIGGTDQGAAPATPPGTASPVTQAPSPTTTPVKVASPVAATGPVVEFLWEATGDADGLDFPAAIALDPQGQLWVADTGHDRFAIFRPDGTFVETWGSPGKDDGQFLLERSNGDGYGAIAFAPDGSFYVLDPGNHRVQKFAADRTFLTAWGGFGQDPGTYTDPIGIAVDTAGTVYVLDDARDVVERYSPDGAALGAFDAHPDSPGGVNTANGLAVDAAGNIYVSDIEPYQILKFDPEGNLVATIGAAGTGAGQFADQPWFMAVDAAGRLFVGVNLEGHQIAVFDANGQFLTAWGGAGEGDNEIAFPTGIVLDGQGNVYVADAEVGRIIKFQLLPPLAAAVGTPTA